MVVIVKKPGVDVPLAQSGLYGGKIHGQITILNNGGDLSESERGRTESTPKAYEIYRPRREAVVGFRVLS